MWLGNILLARIFIYGLKIEAEQKFLWFDHSFASDVCFDIRKYARDGQINFESDLQPDNIIFEPIIIDY
jgi:hypothetical protein